MLDHPLPLKLHQSNQPTVKALYSLKLILRHKKSGRGSADLHSKKKVVERTLKN